MRVAAVLLLSLSAPAGAMPIPDLQGLITANLGNFTTQDIVEALDAVQQCASLPGDFKEFYGMTQCHGGIAETLEVQLGQALLMAKQFQNISNVRVARLVDVIAAYAAKALQGKLHEMNAKICSHSECGALQHKLMQHLSHCEGGYVAAVLLGVGAPQFSFAKVKQAMQEMMTGIFDFVAGSQCRTEPGASGAFCPEMLQSLMVTDFECYMQMFQPTLQKCTPQCAGTWASLKAKYPTCSQVFTSELYGMQLEMQKFAHSMAPSDPTPPPPKHFDDICTKGTDMVV